jgi:FKBP-type peptidyl-prolyl cis-trans isomerase
MRVGEECQLFIPPHLAYARRGAGSIRPNETFLFKVELLNIQ